MARTRILFHYQLQTVLVTLFGVSLWFTAEVAVGQIVPDNTLGDESSVVTPESVNSDLIEGGATRGTNLFHSFEEFNVNEGRGAFFDNPEGILNILTRVTGSNASEIMGQLGVDGNANLFLINPNGITFGPNADIFINGSFVASTADSILFNDFEFSATDPAAPPLLTVNTPIGLGFRDDPGDIVVQPTSQAIIDNSGGLEVGLNSFKETLALIGGDVSLDGAVIVSSDSNLHIGGLAEAGIITFDDSFNFSYPEAITKGDITLFNNTIINVSDFFNVGFSGDINIVGNNVNVNNSDIYSNIENEAQGVGGTINIEASSFSLIGNSIISTTVLGDGSAGDINIRVEEDITVFGSVSETGESIFSRIRSDLNSNSEGVAGNITIEANKIELDRAFITSSTSGIGNAASVSLQAQEIEIDNSGIFSIVVAGASGDGGVILAEAVDSIEIENSTISTAAINSDSETSITAGIVVFDANNINLSNTSVDASITDYGSAGAISIGLGLNSGELANTITIDENSTIDASAYFSDSIENGGVAGVIAITSNEQLEINNTEIKTFNISEGDGGGFGRNVLGSDAPGIIFLVSNNNSILLDQTNLTASTFGPGDAGSVILDAQSITLDDSNIFSDVEDGATGNGGIIEIEAGSFTMENTAQLIASTSGEGEAGKVFIDSQIVTIDNSQIFSQVKQPEDVEAEASGNGGVIEIYADSLALTSTNPQQSSAQIIADTSSSGNAGNVFIEAQTVTLDNSQIFSDVEDGATGNGGLIEIYTDSLTLENDSELIADTSSSGNAGNVFIEAQTVTLDNSQIFSEVEDGASGDGGVIEIYTDSLTLENDSELIANTSSSGDAGNVFIEAQTVTIDNSTIFNQVATETSTGNGGVIEIEAGSLKMNNNANLTASTFGNGNAGDVIITAPQITLDNSRIFSTVEPGANGNSGTVTIETGSLTLNNDSEIQTLVRGETVDSETNEVTGTIPTQGNAGAVNITASDKISLSNESGIYSTIGSDASGNGGVININAGSLDLNSGSVITTAVNGTYEDSTGKTIPAGNGIAGNITIVVEDSVSLSGFGFNQASFFPTNINSILGSGSQGEAGNISIEANTLSLDNLATIAASTQGEGNVGNIFIDVDDSVVLTNYGEIRNNVEAGGVGSGGNIEIYARSLSLIDGSRISAVVFRNSNGLEGGIGTGGNIEINATDFINISGVSTVESPIPEQEETEGYSSGILASTDRDASGNAGNISVITNNFSIADGGVVSTITSNEGNAGLIEIEANNLSITGGGQILNTTENSGNAGNIDLDISETLEISGDDPTFQDRFEEFGPDIVDNQSEQSGIFADTTKNSTGDGGSIFIEDPNQTTLSDGGQISANSEGEGTGGNINLTTDNLSLIDGADISAATNTADGGNITLEVGELLLLLGNSKISAEAGADGDGGNVTIESQFIIATPQEDNDIKASAVEGQGGNIEITTEAIFGLQESDEDTPFSDINASSEFGLDGNVETNTPDVDPGEGLVELPENVVDPDALIAQNVCTQGSESSLVVTGRGGLPPSSNPTIINNDLIQVNLVNPIATEESSQPETESTPTETPEQSNITPAQGWVVNEQGEVFLVSYNPAKTNNTRKSNSTQCQP